MIKPKEVAYYQHLYLQFGLKATPAYNLTAYIHHNFQSDNRKVSRTNAKSPPFKAGFLRWLSVPEADLRRDC